uniref:39S ribosomal protein L37, mitochondrial n=1 Tax=Arion vulgaris TaxID=1028688 RepID=A0A0B7A4B7_9EUPU
MRITVCLCSGIRDVTVRRWNKVWLCRGRFYDPPPRVPKALAEKGINIVEVNKITPKLENWIAPVDDPRFAEPVLPQNQPDWKSNPAFTHSSNIRLYEGVKQACLIANAQHFEGFPATVEKLIGAVDIPEKTLMLQRSIMQSQVWNTDEARLPKPFDASKPRYHYKPQYGITRMKSTQILLRNLLRLSNSVIAEYPSLRNRKQVTDLHLHTHLNYKGNPIIMKEDLDLLVTSDQMLPPFAGKDVMDASFQYTVPDMWPIHPTVDFMETNNYELTNHTGFKTEDMYTCPHTIVQFPRKFHWEEKHYKAAQIMSCLMYTSALARRKYGDDVKVLPEPISIQHVLMDHDHFLFTFFQLNTLDLDLSTGVKNFVWTAEKAQLFKKIKGQSWSLEESLQHDRLEDFEPSAFDKFMAAYLYGVSDVSMKKEAAEE